MLVVGLTGNYGMGKTLVLDEFAKLGASTMDSDSIVGELLKDKDVLDRLRPILGDSCFDDRGNLIKKAVSDLIFRDESLRLQVEDILHPLVFEKVDKFVSNTDADITVVEATLIFERGHKGRFSKTITVYTDEQTAVERLVKGGVGREEALRRLLCQMPVSEKIRLSDYSVDNGGTREETIEQARRIYGELKALAAGARGG